MCNYGIGLKNKFYYLYNNNIIVTQLLFIVDKHYKNHVLQWDYLFNCILQYYIIVGIVCYESEWLVGCIFCHLSFVHGEVETGVTTVIHNYN